MKLICFDMDGVIFKNNNFWYELHKSYGTLKEGKILTEKYLTTNYKKLVEEVIGRLWKDKQAKTYFNLVKKIRYVKGAKQTLKKLKKTGYKIAIISSGSSHLAARVKKECSINYHYANRLLIRNNKVVGSTSLKHWPIRYGNKAEALRKLCAEHNIDLKDVIVVVNENNDIKMARSAGFAIGFCCKDKNIKKYCNLIINKKDLSLILKPIKEFEKRPSLFNVFD